jgi:hypothetical protein
VIVVETAKIYRVGNRRFLTERAAFTHMARVRIAAARPCECEVAEYDGPYLTSPGYTCGQHSEQLRARYARLLRRAWKRGWRPRVKPDPDLHILQHALGLDGYGYGSGYRNHYVATEGSEDFERCQRHWKAARMDRHGPSPMYGGDTAYCYVVTPAGKRYVKEHSPKPPRLTRSQRRYREFLAQDTGLRFGEWLREGRQYR